MMKVIFVASGNKFGGQISSFVRSQYESLKAEGLDMLLCPAEGHGWRAYAKTVIKLRRMIRKEHPDIIHAHYSTCGIVAWLASIGVRYPKNHQSPITNNKSQITNKPQILVSILGSFPSRDFKWRYVRFFIKHIWAGTLAKSKRTANQLGFDLPIVPNGVNTSIFYPVSESEREEMRGRVFSERESERGSRKYIIWCSNPEREEKNWPLAERAVEIVRERVFRESERESESERGREQIELIAVYNKTPQEVAQYMNAADCLLLTSMSEGSPNVIKEAMACNCPIVTTDVGDVQERLDGLSGCYVIPTDNTPTYGLQGVGEWFEKDAQYLAEALRNALDFGKRTKGYDRIIQDGLTIELTAKKIVRLYTLILNK